MKTILLIAVTLILNSCAGLNFTARAGYEDQKGNFIEVEVSESGK